MEFTSIAVYVVAGLQALAGLFGGGKRNTNADIKTLRDGQVTLGNKIATLATQVGAFFRSIFGSTSKLWTRVIKPALSKITTWAKWLQQHLSKWFGPIITALKRVRGVVQKVYRRVIRPILDTIDIVRKTLQLLALLGWDDAKKLDAKLASLSAKIEEPFMLVVRKLNEAINWIDRIITLDGLLQRVTLIRSLIQYRRDVSRIAIRSTFNPLTAEKETEYRRNMGSWTVDEHVQQSTEAILTHDGPIARAAQEHADDLLLMLRG